MQIANSPAPESITTQIAKWAASQIAENLVSTVLTTVVLTSLLYAFRHLLDKDAAMRGKRKKIAFYGLALLLTFAVVHLVLCVTDYFARLGQDIRNATIARSDTSTNKVGGFQCELTDNVGIIQVVASGETNIMVHFSMYVVNSGAPSIATKWKCTAKLIGGATLPSEASPYRNYSPGTNISSEYVLSKDRYLPKVLLEKPLDSGAGKEGWVTFHFPENMLEELMRPGVEYTVEFQDKLAKKTILQWLVPVNFPRNPR